MIERASINEVWVELLHLLYHCPDHQPAPRGIKTHERLGVTLRVTDARNNILYHPVRNLNYRFLVAEFLWIAYGRADVETLAKYNSQMGRFSDNGMTLDGAYGPRLLPQWQYLIDSIVKDEGTRQAVASIWTPKPKPSKDIPCTLSLQFLARNQKLNLIVTMRSSDVWLGLPYDTSTFSLLQGCLAGVLNLEIGFIQFNLGSSHLYESDFTKAKAVLADPSTHDSIRSPKLPYFPPRNNISTPVTLLDVLHEPKKFSIKEWGHAYPWVMYAEVLNSGTWEQARRILMGAHD